MLKKVYIKNKAFTLIEILMVIGIITILSGIVLFVVNNAREQAKVSRIKTVLKNLQSHAQIYFSENGTFAGMCTYNTSGVTAHASIQPIITYIQELIDSNKIRCVVRTSNVPEGGSHFVAADSLETKNFAVAFVYNNRHYGVDNTNIFVLDQTDSNNGNTTTWSSANNICLNQGKKLVPIEFLKAVHDYNGSSGFESAINYWSSTRSSTTHGYTQLFYDGRIYKYTIGTPAKVRCAS